MQKRAIAACEEPPRTLWLLLTYTFLLKCEISGPG